MMVKMILLEVSMAKKYVKIMSSNLLTTTRYPIVMDEGKYDRGSMFKEMMKDSLPDSAGLCEVTQDWLDYLEDACKELGNFGITGVKQSEKLGRNILRSGSGEYVPIMYRSDIYDLVDDGGWWFSKTPDVPSKYELEGHDAMKYDRVFSYAVLREKEGGRGYIHINVHYDHKCDQYTNAVCSALLEEKANELSAANGNIPVVITGDFNCEEDSPAYTYLANSEHGFYDSKYAVKDNDLSATFTASLANGALPGGTGKIIDFVFASLNGFKAVKAEVLKKPHFSDHFAITSDFEY
jgi:endonuclease/exonuclease/phosphatase family metal-dependent hydrolase